MKALHVAALSLVLLLGSAFECKATYCVLCAGTTGDVVTSNLMYTTAVPLDQVGQLGTLTDAFQYTGSITFNTPGTPSSLTGGYEATLTLSSQGLAGNTYSISSYMNATLQSSLGSASTAVLTSASLTTDFVDLMGNTLASVTASNGSLVAGPVTAGPFTVPLYPGFAGFDRVDQIFSASFNGVQAGETLTLNFPNTSALGTPSSSTPEPAEALPLGAGLVWLATSLARRARRR